MGWIGVAGAVLGMWVGAFPAYGQGSGATAKQGQATTKQGEATTKLGEATTKQGEATTISDRKAAPDGVTVGWLVEYPWPDREEASQSWRTIAGELVIAQRGKVVRRIRTEQSFRSWCFWAGGLQVAYEEGGLHGMTECVLARVKDGKEMARIACPEEAERSLPWVKRLLKE